jgi:hypothetical protein
MRLTTEEIQFIDNYLQKAEVVFIDTRAEMTDHIATAIETDMEGQGLDFYTAFKNYMVLHKKDLLANSNVFSLLALKSALIYFKKTFTPLAVGFTIVTALAVHYFFFSYNLNERELIELLNASLLIVVTAQMSITLKKRFAGIERMSMLMALGYNAFLLIMLGLSGFIDDATNTAIIRVAIAVFISLLPAYIVSFFKLRKKLYRRFLKN